MTPKHVDVVVIGGGIAGATAAASLAETHEVALLEQEQELAHHTTSRSAAVYIENEGGPIFHRLSTASRPFFEDPPGADHPIVEPMPVLSIGDESMADALRDEAAEAGRITPTLRFVEGDELFDLCPVLRRGTVAAGMYEPAAGTIDVMGLHQLFVRRARRHGAAIVRSARVQTLTRHADRWHVGSEAGEWTAGVVVNAAGAWGDQVAAMAGVEPVGLQPKRRTAFHAPTNADIDGMPFIYSGIPELQCYAKAESGGQLLCSLSDETNSDPCDARAEEIDVARAIDNLNALTTLDIRSVRTTWAGLRTFAPDRNPVFGWDDRVDGFFWLVGQGGCGIVTSPIAGEITRSLLETGDLPESTVALGLTKEMLAPRRDDGV